MPEIKSKAWIDSNLHMQNRSKWTQQQLEPYAGHWVAWSADGTQVVAHHPELAEVVRVVESKGLSCEEVVFSPVPELDAPDTFL